MPHNFSQLKDLLSKEGGRSLHRQVLILSGDETWQQQLLKNILLGYENDSLWVGEYSPDSFPFIETKKVQSWLGKEKRIVIFDANKEFEPDSFAAISGTVIGGGVFVLLLPNKERWKTIYSSYFGQRLLNSFNNFSEFSLINQNKEIFEFFYKQPEPKISNSCSPPFLSTEQQNTVEVIERIIVEDKNIPAVLISDRGRGKSAALGITIARLALSGIKNIAITAPRLRATDIVFKHIAEELPCAEISRGRVIYGESIIQFFSPDQLIHNDTETDVLFIDEAAAIPVPLLTSFLHKFSQCVFATTIHGYEGTGRGFSLRFIKELNEFKSECLKINMKTPIRWAENDPLEKWMFDLLCLNAEIVDAEILGEMDFRDVQNIRLQKEQLVDDVLLKEVFSLLVLAHYRTRPKDLKNLLDDENISVYVTLYNNHVVAVALVVQEGTFSNSLSTEIYHGKRRPQGNLLAQALTYHCGIKNAATFDYVRIMRIAVHPELQGKGIGTNLLDFIISYEKQSGRDAIGTSFGMNDKLLHFWEKADFSMARVGFTREQTSGEHAAIMLLALSSKGEKIRQEVAARFNSQIPFLLDDILKDLPNKIKHRFKLEIDKNMELSQLDRDDLDSFIKGARNYELCIASINKLFLMKSNLLKEDNFPNKFRIVLTKKIIDKESWSEITLSMNTAGKTATRKLFYKAILYLIENE